MRVVGAKIPVPLRVMSTRLSSGSLDRIDKVADLLAAEVGLKTTSRLAEAPGLKV